ncbi:substrate-binding domain-containing protein [Novosphingobium pituita]|jgi:ABC-type molybdate transport system substrate-binding protein|uniref:Substrate-binding domain-containing protein n=1 Tax=Novosphingobium pituita TaxID=3056842 RepID=A0ABQ6PB49_9SPHN|nr:substrate-binding domain-containing protein [Novosphingobium sp. IK01]GMM62493.1 substrate-binding domain-containing protein [Novosphingobium sp. IK01]
MASTWRAAIAALALTAATGVPAMAQDKKVESVTDLGVYPPWQEGRNDDAVDRGFGFTIADADNLADFHGNPQNPLLSLYVGGNYFFAMAPLVAAFEAKYPEYRGRLYWETIPPGLLVRQMQAGGTVTVGNMTWTVKPDVYLAGEKAVEKQIEAGLLQGPVVPYATNTLAIMVPKGNPAGIKGLADLGRPGVKLAMPNPEFEGIARQIEASLTKAGGASLADAVYKTKVQDGSTQLTHIHHRQTPLWLMQGKAQAGVTWQSEVEFQKQAGHPIEGVDIPAADNTTAIYAGAVAKNAAHPEAARRWLAFVRSPEGLAIFERYGFKPYTGAAK